MPQKPVFCRLCFLLARDAPGGVIFRRGPSRWVRMIRWRTDTDALEYGQWFHGHVYVHRCDLSPSGDKLIYFCNKFTPSVAESSYTYAWTAVSRPPYFTALALWPKGNCWHGGGLFIHERHIWLNHRPEHAEPHPDHRPPRRIRVQPNPFAHGEDWPVMERRLERDGWVFVRDVEAHHRDRQWFTDVPGLAEKEHGSRRLTLQWLDSRVGPYGWPDIRYDYRVVDSEKRVRFDAGEAEWADWDHRGRMVFVREGKLLAWDSAAPESVSEIADFNDDKPAAVPPPPKAFRW